MVRYLTDIIIMMKTVNLQQEMLEAEGVVFNAAGRCELETYQWWPEGYFESTDVQPQLFG